MTLEAGHKKVFLIRNNHFPDGLNNLLERTSGIHLYNSRSSSINAIVPGPHTKAAKRAFRYIEWP